MGRSRDARTLQVLLRAETGIDGVEVRWDQCAGGRGFRWHVLWPDDPTEEAMRGHLTRLVALHWLDLDPEQLALARVVQPLSVALAMVRNVRLGQPPLGGWRAGWELADHVAMENYPERGAAEDLALAAVLVRLTGGVQSAMAKELTRTSLAGLREQLVLPANVIPLRPRR